MQKIKLLPVIIIVFVAFIMNACLDDEFEQAMQQQQNENPVYTDFDFETTQEFSFTVQFLTAENKAYAGVYVQLFTDQPFEADGTLVSGYEQNRVFQGMSDKNGQLHTSFNLSTSSDSLFIVVANPGLPALSAISLSSEDISISIGGSSAETKNARSLAVTDIPDPNQVNGYYILGDWNSQGVPNYLEGINDVVTTEFLDDINASLPENIALPVSHPQYLANDNDANLVINEDCEIWVTFVHEGAGWLNVLGYYFYPTGEEPATVDDISNLTIVFPNVSYQNSGGGLISGNKVQLLFLDEESNAYSTIFPAGYTVGWFVNARGWSSGSVTSGVYTHYSDVHLNNEEDPDLRKHNVMLYDDERDILLLGFEDIRRDQGSDEDFNDAVFYATVSPFTAVERSFYQPIDSPEDTDRDGTSDVFDQFPEDPELAFNNYYPGENKFGTLVFEDLWPYKGDYDFNDLVIDYNFNQLTNAQNEVVAIQSKMVTRAIGASYHNGFGIELNVSSGTVASISGQQIEKGYINLQNNGTESGNAKASVIYFDDAYNVLPYPGTGICVNTYEEYPYVTPDTQFVDISFTSPVSLTEIGTPPYNPFMIIDRDRGVEVHLPNKAPTELANLSLLGTGDDDSELGTGKYYVSDKYLPWAINLPVSFDYPKEKKDITQTHLMFNNWATSMGYNYMDWYNDNLGYRNGGNIYE